jgi:hypothetical protein
MGRSGSSCWRFGVGLVICALMAMGPTAQAQSAPPLGTAETFAVLAGSAVTNTGASVVTGDLGIWPNNISSVTGFPPGSITGTLHAGNAVALQAQSDLTTAYNNAAGQACGTVLTGTNLGGLTLTPGVYCFATSAQLTGTLTLDAQGNPDAVFIFQIGSTLTTASAARVEMINGGSGCRVYWQVGSSATLGTGTAFQGNILALASITMTTGASVNGRLLARNGAVTLDTSAAGGCNAGVCPIIDLAPTTLPQGTLGVAYSATISASGGQAPYVYSVSAGSLPTGLALNANSGSLSGLPTALGNFSFTVRAVDANGCERSRTYTIVIAAAVCPTITVAPTALPNATVGSIYSQTISASGGNKPFVYSVTAGALPPGLLFNGVTGLLSGTVTTIGSFSFTITATDANACVGSRNYTIVVSGVPCPPINLTPTTLPQGTLGTAYSATISANGGQAPYAYSVSAGTLPQGLMLNPKTGVLSGTPTALGNFAFTIRAVDANGCEQFRVYSIVIAAVICPPITLLPASLPNATVGLPYSQTLSASGGQTPYVYSVTAGALPPGLLLNGTSGLLSGTVTMSGSYNFTITATDANGCLTSRAYTLVVNVPPCPPINLAPATLPPATQGLPYSATLIASGGQAPYVYSVSAGALPQGLALNPQTGVLSGTITTLGSFTFTIRAVDANGCFTTREYTLVVNAPPCPPINLAPATLPPATLGAAYSATLIASGGQAPYVYSVSAGTLPKGLLLNAQTGVLSGTPSTLGSFTFTIRAVDANGCFTTRVYTLVVSAAPCPLITLTPANLPMLVSGVPFSQTFTASGGTAPYAYSVTAGTLPQGLALNPQTGVLSGTPGQIGDFSFRITAIDALGCSADVMLTARVFQQPRNVPALQGSGLMLLLAGFVLLGGLALRR